TIRLRVKEPDIGVVGTTVVAWPTMLTSGAAGSSGTYDDTVRLRRMQPAAAPAEPAPEPLPPPFEPPAPAPELRAARDPELAVPPRSGFPNWAIVLIALLIVGGAGYAAYDYFKFNPQDVVATAPPPATRPAAAEPPKKSIRDTVADYLATRPAPTPEAMLAKGRDWLKAGDTASAFLVFRRAAEAGNTAAQLELATFYDPLTQPARGGFTPEGARAADWYERAALA
ncbi:unnamed protein product, partial [Phaeothamnion confervicola]